MNVGYRDLGTVPYGECWRLQQELFDRTLERQASGEDPDLCGEILTVEHPPVFTLGRRARESNVLVSEEFLRSSGAGLYHIDRGGDVTFHGPGQTVCYPILDLSRIGMGLRRYIEILEQSVIDTIAAYGIEGKRIEGATGVWIENVTDVRRPHWNKICAIGVRASRFVVMHGLALNVSTDLEWFRMINPCGFTDKGVTSLSELAGKTVGTDEVRIALVRHLATYLGAELI